MSDEALKRALVYHATTKAQADRDVIRMEVFCDEAATVVRSMMPIGLGKYWQKEAEELEFLLIEIPMRFKRAVEKGQAKGWAAK